MFYLFFALAARSPSRQRTFRRAVAAHLCVLAGVVWALYGHRPGTAPLLLGHVLLVAGIVEGSAIPATSRTWPRSRGAVPGLWPYRAQTTPARTQRWAATARRNVRCRLGDRAARAKNR